MLQAPYPQLHDLADEAFVALRERVIQEAGWDALCDQIVIIAGGKVSLHDSPEGIRNATGCDDLEDAFVQAIDFVGGQRR